MQYILLCVEIENICLLLLFGSVSTKLTIGQIIMLYTLLSHLISAL